MGQVIEVRLIAPNGEIIVDQICATSVKYDATNHLPAHEEVIKLALKQATGDGVQVKRIKRENGPKHAGAGTTSSWYYEYEVVLAAFPGEDPETEHDCLGVLFAQYREKGKDTTNEQK